MVTEIVELDTRRVLWRFGTLIDPPVGEIVEHRKYDELTGDSKITKYQVVRKKVMFQNVPPEAVNRIVVCEVEDD